MKKVIVVFSIITSIAVIGICFPDLALAYDFTNVEVKADETPKDLQGVGITEHLGESIDLTNTFVDSNGKTVQLAIG